MVNYQLGSYLCVGILGLLWFFSLCARLYTLAQYFAADNANPLLFVRRIADYANERRFIVVNVGFVILIFALFNTSTTFRNDPTGDSRAGVLLAIFALNYVAAPLARHFNPHNNAAGITKRPSLLTILVAAAASVLVSTFLAATILDILRIGVTPLGFIEDPITIFSTWAIAGGALSFLVAIIAVAVIGPIIAAVESALGIRAE